MEITHVLCGEDLFIARQIVVYEALEADRRRQRAGLPTVRPPAGPCWAHGNRQVCPSATPGSGLAESTARSAVSCEKALLNYLALLGWAIADDRDVFTIERRWLSAFDDPPGQPQPRSSFDAQEVRGDQRRAHPPALSTHDELADRAWCRYLARRRVLAAPSRPTPGAVVAAGRRRPADPGADGHPGGAGRAWSGFLFVVRRRRSRDRRGLTTSAKPLDGDRVLDAAQAAGAALGGVEAWATTRADRGSAA